MSKCGEPFNRIENIKYKNYLFTVIEYNDMFNKCFGIKLDESIISSVIERITKMDDWIKMKNKKSSEIAINPRELFKDLINKFYRGFYYIKLEDNHLEMYMKKTGCGEIPFSLNLRILNIYPTDITFDEENYIKIVKNY